MLYYGACYYPEHWTAAQAKDHIGLMKKARINVVRMGEFAWCKFEPEQGRFRFDWLDSVIEALRKEKIATVLCTPTCIPPQWVLSRHPNILQHDRNGHVRNPGARCHACKNAPEYQLLCDSIVDQMARHYADMPGVIGWQTDNEFGCHGTTRCYCEHCEKAFREWLLEKYGDTDTINEAWGTAFWGFDFRFPAEIPLPKQMPAGPNPGHWLDFLRFSSETQVRFHKAQYDQLKLQCPKHFVTHNLMGRFPEIDYHRLAEHTDFASWDNYPDSAGDQLDQSYAHEITRSFKGSFWVMEERSGATGDAAAGIMGEQPETGDIRRWTWQAVANGAEGVSYFRWRVCLTGAEQYWHGILDHDGVPRSRYAEVARTGEEFAKLGPLLKGTRVEPPVALVRNFDTLWSVERQPAASNFTYDGHCFEMYRAVKRTGLCCDMVNTDSDLRKYKVVLAPCLSLVDEATAKRLVAFVEGGGTLVLTPQSGTRTETNAMTAFTRPGLLAKLAGITVEKVMPFHHGQTEPIEFLGDGAPVQSADVGTWIEVLECRGAEAVAKYTAGRLDGKAAITSNAHGKGKVVYMGVYLEREALEPFLARILPDFPVKDIPEDLEVTLRRGKEGTFLFAINHGKSSRTVTLPGTYQDLLSGEKVGPELKVARNGIVILKV